MTTDGAKMIFGYLLMVGVFSLAAAVALGKVHADSSFGFQELLGGILVLCGGFSQWAFGGGRDTKKPDV